MGFSHGMLSTRNKKAYLTLIKQVIKHLWPPEIYALSQTLCPSMGQSLFDPSCFVKSWKNVLCNTMFSMNIQWNTQWQNCKSLFGCLDEDLWPVFTSFKARLSKHFKKWLVIALVLKSQIYNLREYSSDEKLLLPWASSKIDYVGCGSAKKKRSEKTRHHQVFLNMG